MKQKVGSYNQRLGTYRKRLDVKLEQLAAEIDKSRSYVWRREQLAGHPDHVILTEEEYNDLAAAITRIALRRLTDVGAFEGI